MTRHEQRILEALVTNLGAVGFKPAAVWTGEDYQLANGTSCKYDDAPDAVVQPMTLEEVIRVFAEFDMATPTIHFTYKHLLTWGNHGVMVAEGNGVDFICDWHVQRDGFDVIVDQVASAASEGVYA